MPVRCPSVTWVLSVETQRVGRVACASATGILWGRTFRSDEKKGERREAREEMRRERQEREERREDETGERGEDRG